MTTTRETDYEVKTAILVHHFQTVIDPTTHVFDSLEPKAEKPDRFQAVTYEGKDYWYGLGTLTFRGASDWTGYALIPRKAE